MNHLRNGKSLKRDANGAALIVCLVMLTAVTFLAVISLQKSAVQIRIIGNEVLHERSFQTALSELTAQFGNLQDDSLASQFLADAMRNVSLNNGEVVRDSSDNPVYLPLDLAVQGEYQDDRLNIAPSVRYRSAGIRINRTFAGDSSSDKFVSHKFQYDANVNVATRINSTQQLGIDYLASTGR